jgi:hypothetical protein
MSSALLWGVILEASASKGPVEQTRQLALSPEGDKIAVASTAKRVIVLHREADSLIDSVISDGAYEPHSITYGADNKTLFVGDDAGRLHKYVYSYGQWAEESVIQVSEGPLSRLEYDLVSGGLLAFAADPEREGYSISYEVSEFVAVKSMDDRYYLAHSQEPVDPREVPFEISLLQSRDPGEARRRIARAAARAIGHEGEARLYNELGNALIEIPGEMGWQVTASAALRPGDIVRLPVVRLAQDAFPARTRISCRLV